MMHNIGLRFVANAAARLVTRLPVSVAEAVAETLAPTPVGEWATCRANAVGVVAHPHYRSLIVTFLDDWRVHAADISPQAVAAALLTASSAEHALRERQSVELAWTGPDVDVVPLRRTEQAILQVIGSAKKRLTV